MSAVTVRPAVEADCEAIAAMVRALADRTSLPSGTTPQALHREAFGPRPTVSMIVAEAGGNLVGCVVVQDTFSSWRGENGLFVTDLFVAAEQRGGGLGRRLLAAAARAGQARGARFMRLDIEPENEAAARFYARLGFHPVPFAVLALEEADMAALAEEASAPG